MVPVGTAEGFSKMGHLSNDWMKTQKVTQLSTRNDWYLTVIYYYNDDDYY